MTLCARLFGKCKSERTPASHLISNHATPRQTPTMHWHAIRRSTRPRRQESIASGDDAREIPHPCALGNLPRDKASGHGSPHEKSKTIPTATDATRVDTPMGSSQEAPVQPIGEVQAILSLFQLVSDPTQDPTDNNKDETPRSSFNNSDEELSTADDTGDHSFIQVDIPKTPSGISTFEHERAMRNRIPRDKLDRNAIYDKHKYTPTFLHDCLVLPGSLANLIGKVCLQTKHNQTWLVAYMTDLSSTLAKSRQARSPYDSSSPLWFPDLRSSRDSTTLSSAIVSTRRLRSRHGTLRSRP